MVVRGPKLNLGGSGFTKGLFRDGSKILELCHPSPCYVLRSFGSGGILRFVVGSNWVVRAKISLDKIYEALVPRCGW